MKSLNRRTFLRSAGVCLALPFLDAMIPVGRAASQAFALAREQAAKRLVCIGNPFGMIPERFFPTESGTNYALPSLLQPLSAHQRDFTIFSNLDHGVTGGHRTAHTFLSGIRIKEAKMMPEGNISIDQKAAEFVGVNTRFPSLNVSINGHCEMSWTRTGVRVPPINDPRKVFQALFVDTTAQEKEQRAIALDQHGSILDAVMGEARSFERKLGQKDREKLEEYLTSVRTVEKKLGHVQSVAGQTQTPRSIWKCRKTAPLSKPCPLIYDLIALALQTDSTRIATLEVGQGIKTTDLGLNTNYHKYSHHGKLPELMEGLTIIEKYQMKHLGLFFDKLKAIEDPAGGTLFDHTMVLSGSGMGNGSSHSNKNLPILLAGGGFNHGQHMVFPEAKPQRVPLSNLYLSMLQNFRPGNRSLRPEHRHAKRIRIKMKKCVLFLLIGILSSSTVWAEGDATYKNTVRTFLSQRCYKCHGAELQKADLRFDTLTLDFHNEDVFANLAKHRRHVKPRLNAAL